MKESTEIAKIDHIERRLDHSSVSTSKMHFQVNPVNNAESTQRPAPEFLNEKQVTALLAASSESEGTQDLHDVVRIVLNTGPRVGELCELRFADVGHHKRQFVIWANKSCTRRVVPFVPEILQIVESRRERHPDSEYVFGEARQGLIQRVSRQLSILAPRIGVRRLTLQTLRRTFLSRLLCAGAEPAVIMAIGGWTSYGASINRFMRHSDVEVTRAYYSALDMTNGGKQ